MACEIAENMKTRYYQQVHALLQLKRKTNESNRRLMVASWTFSMEQLVINTKRKAELNGIFKLSTSDQAILENYDVIMINNKPTLVKKSKDKSQVNKVVIPLESSFEWVLNAHLYTRHGGSKKMNKWININNFVVSKLCVTILIELCKLMNKDCITGIVKGLEIVPIEGFQFKQVSVTPKTTNDVSVAIIDMTSQPDSSFGYILVYTDLKTQFIQLRPIRATDMANEITMELIKIFCDFSSPKNIKVHPNIMYEFSPVLDNLNIFHTNSEITLEICSKMYVSPVIVEKLMNWMMLNGSCWSIGCHFVQWDMNNTMEKNGTSFSKFFGLKRYQRKTEVERKARRNVKKKSKCKKCRAAMKTDKNNETKMENSIDIDIKSKISTNDKEIIPTSNNTVIEINFANTQLDTFKVTCFTRGVNDSNTSNDINCTTSNVFKYVTSNIPNDTTSNVLDYNKSNVSNCTTLNDSNCATTNDSNCTTTNTLSNCTTFSHVDKSATSNVMIPATDTQASIENNDVSSKERFKCHTCELTIENEVYFCSVCKKSLHLYCGAYKRNSKGVESICFMCL